MAGMGGRGGGESSSFFLSRPDILFGYSQPTPESLANQLPQGNGEPANTIFTPRPAV